MRVSIKHATKEKGLLLKTTYYEVAVTVLLTHEETQIVRQRNLINTTLMDRRPATAKVDDRDDQFALRVYDLTNGKTDRFLCATPADAKRYEANVLDALVQLKDWISDNAEISEGIVVEF